MGGHHSNSFMGPNAQANASMGGLGGPNGNDGDMAGGMDIDSGDKRKAFSREYIDYDDPTQFDRQGQRITGQSAAAAQTQMQLQQQHQ